MPALDYLDFDLEVEASATPGTYEVSVLSSPRGEASGEMTFPLNPDALENVILKLGRTRSGVRAIGSPTQQVAKQFGSTLYDALFAGEVGTCFRRSLDEAQALEEAEYRLAAAELLARWPMLDDPWHPDHARVLARHRAAILEHLEQSDGYANWLAAREEVDRLGTRSWELRTRAAPYERLARAVESTRLAARLRARGGEGWATFERILACERGVP